MSLILEALRKSEAERRRAQVPDLLAEPQPAAVALARPATRWPWIAGLGALAFVAVWLATRTPTAAPIASTPATIQADASREIAPPAAAPVATRTTRTATLPQRPIVVAPPARPVAPAASATPPRAEPESIAPPPAAPIAAAPMAAAPAAPSPAIAARDTTERIADLGNEERKQLPPLKLSMHMWNDVTAQRFVIIDGARLGVGDHLGPVVVADILPDGVLLDWNGRALKLPLR